VRQVRDLTRRIAEIAPGTSARLDILRGGNRQTVHVTIGRMGDQVQRAALPNNERAVPSASETLDRLGLELSGGRNGVTVSALDPNGAAARRGLREGDIIVEVAGEPVTRPDEVARQIEAARTEGRGSVLARVRSANGLRFVPLPVDRS
jgi:serine protease Do